MLSILFVVVLIPIAGNYEIDAALGKCLVVVV